MADISDITAYLATAATTAIYPNGSSQSSIVPGTDMRVFEGWPIPDQLDLDMGGYTLVNSVKTPRTNGPMVDVSVFPMLGNTATPYQILDDTYLIIGVSYGLALSVVGNTITFSGTPNPGEYVSIIADRQYAHSETGATAAAIISALATDFSANYSGVSSTSSTLTIPYNFSFVVRQGGQGTLGKVTHRQKQSIMVSIWAPTHALRTTVAAAVDNYIKQNIKVTMPDTSQAIITYNRTNVIDDQQVATIYRRDLIYDCEYATVFEFPGFVVTITETQITAEGGVTPPTVTALA